MRCDFVIGEGTGRLGQLFADAVTGVAFNFIPILCFVDQAGAVFNPHTFFHGFPSLHFPLNRHGQPEILPLLKTLMALLFVLILLLPFLHVVAVKDKLKQFIDPRLKPLINSKI
jgi:hypothetical protein